MHKDKHHLWPCPAGTQQRGGSQGEPSGVHSWAGTQEEEDIEQGDHTEVNV